MLVGRPGTARCTALTIALAAACAIASLFAATSTAATNWTPPRDLSAPGKDANEPLVAMHPGGEVTAIWERKATAGIGTNLQMSTRPVGGDFSPPVDVALKAGEPRIAMAPDGTLYVLWKQFEPSNRYTIRLAVKPQGGPLSAPEEVHRAPVGGVPSELDLAVGAGGDVVVAWSDIDPTLPFEYLVCGYTHNGSPISCPNPSFVMTAIRKAGNAEFYPAARLFPPRGQPAMGETQEQREARETLESKRAAFAPRPAVDANGNAIVAYTYSDEETPTVRYSFRDAAGTLAGSQLLSPAGEDSTLVDVNMDAAGNAVASWLFHAGSSQTLKAAARPPGGEAQTFQQLGSVSAPGASAQDASLHVAQDGTATALWRRPDILIGAVQISVRPPGGVFQPPQQIGSGKDDPRSPRLATNAAGDALVVWSGDNGANQITRASVRPAGGSFSAPIGISVGAPSDYRPVPAVDAAGNGAVVWLRGTGGDDLVQLTGYDAVAPQLDNVSIPAQATVGQTVDVFGSGSDLWGTPAISASFGDGASAAGPAASHVYSAPGTYTVGVTATDVVGRTTTSSAPIVVKARNFFAIGRLKKNRRKGTATLQVTVPEPGTVTIAAKGLKKTIQRVSPGTATLRLTPTRKGLRKLARTGVLKVRLVVSFLPDGGDESRQQRRVTLSRELGGESRGSR